MNEENWTRWIMQTARTWNDISKIIKTTGIDTVDHDHQKLLEYALELNQLIENLNQDKFNLVYLDEQRFLLDKLYQYTEQHFSREEKLMEHYSIPDTAYHLKQHKEILSSLKAAISEFNAGKITVSIDLKLSILEWVVVHINEVDAKTFSLKNWQHVLEAATSWNDIKEIIKRTDIELVDNEHRMLVESSLKINSVFSKAVSGKEQVQEAHKILDELDQIVHQHFKDEEDVMKQYQLPNLSTQQEQHAMFHTILHDTINKPDDILISSLKSFKISIMEWWIHHINTLDFQTLSLSQLGHTLIENSNQAENLYCMIKKTGISQVDEEHLKLINKTMEIAQFFNKQNKEIDSQIAEKLFIDLQSIAREHFSHEEALMKQQQNPLYDSHHNEHQRLLEEFEIIHQQYKKGLITFTNHLKTKLINWWINHTNKIDIETFGEAGNG